MYSTILGIQHSTGYNTILIENNVTFSDNVYSTLCSKAPIVLHDLHRCMVPTVHDFMIGYLIKCTLCL